MDDISNNQPEKKKKKNFQTSFQRRSTKLKGSCLLLMRR